MIGQLAAQRGKTPNFMSQLAALSTKNAKFDEPRQKTKNENSLATNARAHRVRKNARRIKQKSRQAAQATKQPSTRRKKKWPHRPPSTHRGHQAHTLQKKGHTGHQAHTVQKKATQATKHTQCRKWGLCQLNIYLD